MTPEGKLEPSDLCEDTCRAHGCFNPQMLREHDFCEACSEAMNQWPSWHPRHHYGVIPFSLTPRCPGLCRIHCADKPGVFRKVTELDGYMTNDRQFMCAPSWPPSTRQFASWGIGAFMPDDAPYAVKGRWRITVEFEPEESK